MVRRIGGLAGLTLVLVALMAAVTAIALADDPPLYLATEGPRGKPDSKQCPGCGKFLEGASRPGIRRSWAHAAPGQSGTSGWGVLESQGFEDDPPWASACQYFVDGSDDGYDRTWGASDLRAHGGERALWPAAGGTDPVEPELGGDYPGDLDSWLVCGPLDLSQASTAYVSFWLWLEIEEGHDEFFVGVSDGSDDWFEGYTWGISSTQWTEHTVYIPAYTGGPQHDSVWIAWNFQSDAANATEYEGAWLDDVEIARSLPCPVVDPGPKGLNVHPNELPAHAGRIADAGANWVRLELLKGPSGTPDLERYEAIVDSLCEQGVAPIALVDYATIPEDLDGEDGTDYDDPDAYVAYQQRFTETVEALAHHFRGNVRHWEVWNEENGGTWFIRPEYYARLLSGTSKVLKEVDPDNQVLFGGLEHVWVTSQYLEPVYNSLGDARPFDILAVHPYAVYSSGVYILDPKEYLWDEGPPRQTVLDPYLDLMDARGDGDKGIWITEIGWNSALDNPAIEKCPTMKAWCVDRATQAGYLVDSFDILFQEVEDSLGHQDRVQTIVWYTFHDTGMLGSEMVRRWSLARAMLNADPDAICPADWGLVDGNRVPKPSYWAYQLYPEREEGWSLASFVAAGIEQSVDITWSTFSETQLLGFNLLRADTPQGARLQLNGGLIPAQQPGGSNGATYAFEDSSVAYSTTYFYFLEAVGVYSPSLVYGPERATTGDEPPPSPLQGSNSGPTVLGQPTTLTATLTVTDVVPLTYTWAFGDGQGDVGRVVTHTYEGVGVYTAVVTAPVPALSLSVASLLSGTVTELTATTTITVDELITGLLATNDSPTLRGQATTLTATIEAGSQVTYTWAFGDGLLGAGAVATHTYSATNVYTAVVTASNSVSSLTNTTTVVVGPGRFYFYLPIVTRTSLMATATKNFAHTR